MDAVSCLSIPIPSNQKPLVHRNEKMLVSWSPRGYCQWVGGREWLGVCPASTGTVDGSGWSPGGDMQWLWYMWVVFGLVCGCWIEVRWSWGSLGGARGHRGSLVALVGEHGHCRVLVQVDEHGGESGSESVWRMTYGGD